MPILRQPILARGNYTQITELTATSIRATQTLTGPRVANYARFINTTMRLVAQFLPLARTHSLRSSKVRRMQWPQCAKNGPPSVVDTLERGIVGKDGATGRAASECWSLTIDPVS
jgi:hypothetical protein